MDLNYRLLNKIYEYSLLQFDGAEKLIQESAHRRGLERNSTRRAISTSRDILAVPPSAKRDSGFIAVTVQELSWSLLRHGDDGFFAVVI